MKENFGDILKKIRLEKGFSLRQLSIKTGISHSYISEIEKNRYFKRETVEKLVKALNVDDTNKKLILKKLDYVNTPVEVLKELEKLKKKNNLQDDYKNENKEKSNIGSIIFEEMINVPVYDSVSAGCQDGLEPNPEPIEYVSLPKRMAEGCVIVNVHGESMKPTLNDGSSVLIKLDTEVGHNEIGVFIYDDEPLVKRYKCFDGKRFLYSDNQDYPPREVRDENSFSICGKVIWIMAKQ